MTRKGRNTRYVTEFGNSGG